MDHPRDIIKITVMPDIGMLTTIQKITSDVGGQLGLEKDAILKVSLALEEVFSYCLKLIQTEKNPPRITLIYRNEQTSMHIIIEHHGPRGTLEKNFLPGREGSFKMTSFEAIGLQIARNLMDDLRYVQLFDGTNRFTIEIQLPPAVHRCGPSTRNGS
jgi:anti-sigma regulatory factor (Ser/Thr protein kinase)